MCAPSWTRVSATSLMTLSTLALPQLDDATDAGEYLAPILRKSQDGCQVSSLALCIVPKSRDAMGDAYLRTLLIHGARIVIHHASKRADSCSWLNQMVARRNKNITAVALANKNARTVWALLAHDREYRMDHQSVSA